MRYAILLVLALLIPSPLGADCGVHCGGVCSKDLICAGVCGCVIQPGQPFGRCVSY